MRGKRRSARQVPDPSEESEGDSAALGGAGDVEQIRSAVFREVRERPPTLGVIGVSGVGKSSTLNAMFGTGLPTSDTVACTKEFLAVGLELTSVRGRSEGLAVPLQVVDAPGLGEDLNRDSEYLRQYVQHLPMCDAVLWITAARSRAVSLDQMYLEALSDFHDRMLFGVNQVDLVEPLDWSDETNLPSLAQEDAIGEILADRKDRFEAVVGRQVPIEAYSAKRGFRLQSIFTALVDAVPDDRGWIYSELKTFKHDDFVPSQLRAAVGADELQVVDADSRDGSRSGRRYP